ncbi:MAG: hypothetical protein KC544_09450 [Gemmatimonadetes bacterium]|nr:hypothetical protein [Gemmatimonadota bacterium]MCA9763336.1 hypothetical protein [Gemmatimonadota bacterium]HPF61731.1 hypothetical protein [Gemmatimonadales bacterium]HRX18418.1 hypothetical protein [Gemmatimonadales bacterium]
MSEASTSSGRPAPLLARRNLLLALAGLVTIGAGYGVLASGSPSLAAVLLVIGYVVLMPLALLV